MRNLKGKRVLITGGCGGIGRALAVRLARERAVVILTDVADAPLDEVAAAVRHAGGTAQTHVVDVTDGRQIESLREALVRQGAQPDVVINNAGVVFGGPLVDVSWERHSLTYEVNLLGLVRVTRCFLPDLVERPEAHLVNVASAAGLLGLPFATTYASSKWAVIGFSESVRLELKQQGHRHVGVSVICPSYVDTGMFDGTRPPRATRMLTPERVARLTVRAIHRNRPRVLTPWLVKVVPAIRALLPPRLVDLISGLFGVDSGMVSWRGRGGP
jgi:short-subunit dehydrogenase